MSDNYPQESSFYSDLLFVKVLNKMKDIDKRSILDSSEKYENAYYEFLRRCMDRLMQGFFIFKTRKGELLAGATTFYTLMTLSPLLLLVITIYGKAVGNLDEAYNDVMVGIKEGIPHLAPWIHESLQKIIKAQLSKDSLNWVNIGLLFYTGSGLSATLVFGMSNIADVQQRGGWIVETFKSLISAAMVTAFIVITLSLSFHADAVMALVKDVPVLRDIMLYVSKGAVQIVLFTGLFTLYFKHITPKNIRYSDALFGAITTISFFVTAKSFYWVYIHYMRSELQQSFGNFYTIIIAVLYIYFMVCSFFYGAATAYAPSYSRGKINNKKVPKSEDLPPELPKAV